MYRVNSKVNTAVWLCKETWYQRHTGDKQKEKPTWNVLERRWSPLATKAASELLCIQSATFSELYWRDEHLSSSRFVLILCFHDGARVLSDMSVQNIDTGCSSVVKVFSKNSKLFFFFFAHQIMRCPLDSLHISMLIYSGFFFDWSPVCYYYRWRAVIRDWHCNDEEYTRELQCWTSH